MLSRLLACLSAIDLQEVAAIPVNASRRLTPPSAGTAQMIIELLNAGTRGSVSAAAALSETAVRVGRVVRNAVTPQVGYWRAGSRMHFCLPHRPEAEEQRVGRVEDAARKVAAELAEHPDVLSAYWDGGLERLVVQAGEGVVRDVVADAVSRLAAKRGLQHSPEPTWEHVHPGAAGGVRTSALALACDAAGIGTAVAARSAFLARPPRSVSAVVTLLREDSRVRAALHRTVGVDGADLVLALAYAAAAGLGQSPTPLLLDAALRTVQLVSSLAQLAAFDAVHDILCAPDRLTLAGKDVVRPPLRACPGEEYADAAVKGMLAGAATTLLFTRNADEAAETVLAGSPKAARYGPGAFIAVLSSALAREEVLVRDRERLRRLDPYFAGR